MDGTLVGEAAFELPWNLPLGWHRMVAHLDAEALDPASTTSTVVVTPHRLTLPEGLDDRRAVGVATQLYQVRSSESWGIGDLDDLARLGTWASSQHGADFVLVNPLHAAEPVAPDGALAVPADEPPVPQPPLPAGRGRPGGPAARPGRRRAARGAGGARAGAQRGRRDRPRRVLGAEARRPRPGPLRRAHRRAGPTHTGASWSWRARASWPTPPGARWPRPTGCRSTGGRPSCATRTAHAVARLAGGARRRGRPALLAAVAARRAGARGPGRRCVAPVCASAWSRTSPSGSTRRVRTRGRCPTCWPAGCRSGRRRTSSTSWASGGTSRRGVRIALRSKGIGRSATWFGPRCATPVACGSTT